MHIPLDIENAVAKAGFQFGCHRTCPLMDLNLVFVVDIAQSVIAGNRVAATGEFVLCDVFLREVNRFLAVEFLWNDEEIWFG